jgi:hypothetical protein
LGEISGLTCLPLHFPQPNNTIAKLDSTSWLDQIW